MRTLCLVVFFQFVLINTSGQFVSFDWVKSCDRSQPSYELQYVGVDQSENVYHSGNFWNTTDLDPGSGVYTITCTWSGVFVTKLDQLGNFIWGANISGNRFTYLTSQFTDAAGNTYITGRFSGTTDFDPGPGVYNLSMVEGTSMEAYAIFILKLGPNGEFKWAKKIADFGINAGLSIVADNSGNVYTTGNFEGTVDFDPGPGVFMLGHGPTTAFVLKLDANGNFVFARDFECNYYSAAYYLKVDNVGNLYVSGTFGGTIDCDPGPAVYNLTTDLNSFTAYIIKLNAAGNFVFAKKDVGGPFVVDASQNIFTFDRYLSKYDASGNHLWTKTTGASPFSFDLSNHVSPIDIDTAGNVYINSLFRYTQDFDPGPGVFTMSTFDGGYNSDVFFSRFDNDGNFVWAKKIGGYFEDLPHCIILDAGGNIYSTGVYYGIVDFDPGPGVYTVIAPHLSDVYVHKMDRCTAANGISLVINACNSYTLNNIIYNSSGTYYQTLQNAAGCDSMLTLHITIDGTNDTVSVSSCDSYDWRGHTLTNSGFYRDTFASPSGCNSIYNLDLVIKNKSISIINTAICEGDNYAGHTVAGTYIDTFTAANGCDSIRTLNLAIKPKSYFTLYKAICKGDSYLGYSTPGTYVDKFTSVNGCDSIRTLQLSVNPNYGITIDKNICEGDSFLGHTVSGAYTDILSTVAGCDSIITTHLVVDMKPVITLGNDTTLCLGQTLLLKVGQFKSYLWQDGSIQDHLTVSQTGLYSLTVTNSCGSSNVKKNVIVEKCLCLFPNAFTPNSDNKNDVFKITNGFGLKDFRLAIFNRYGEKVFETNDPLKGWDGSYKNQKQEEGAFTWHCIYIEGFQSKNITGIVLLLR